MWFASDSTSFQPPDSPSRSEENKKAKGEDFFNNKLPQFLKIIDAHLKKNGGKWMVGNSVSDVTNLSKFFIQLCRKNVYSFCTYILINGHAHVNNIIITYY